MLQLERLLNLLEMSLLSIKTLQHLLQILVQELDLFQQMQQQKMKKSLKQLLEEEMNVLGHKLKLKQKI